MKAYCISITSTRTGSSGSIVARNKGLFAKKIAEIISRFNGISIVEQAAIGTNGVYRSFDFGNGEGFALYFNGTYSYPVLIGAIEDGHTISTEPSTKTVCHESLYTTFQCNFWAFADDNNKLVGLWFETGGWMFFYYEEDGSVKVAFQGKNKIDNSTSYILYGDILNGEEQKHYGTTITLADYVSAGVLICTGEEAYIPPTGKMIKWSGIQLDKMFNAEKARSYPAMMFGKNMASNTDASTYATLQKIQIGTQKYVHVGGFCWMPYDTLEYEDYSVT